MVGQKANRGSNVGIIIRYCLIPPSSARGYCRYREKWIRVATNIFIPSRERNIRNLTLNKNKVFRPENRARESVTQGEGISTHHAHRTRWYPPMFVSI